MPVRERTPEDVPAAVAALRRVHETDGYPVNWPADPAAWLTPPAPLGLWVAETSGVGMGGGAGSGAGGGADSGGSVSGAGRVVGQAGLVTGAVPASVREATGLDEDDVAWVTRLYIAPAGRGQGLGRALLDTCAAAAKTLGRTAILDVDSGGAAAVAMYERAGWRRAHSGPAEWTLPSGEPAWLHYYVSP